MSKSFAVGPIRLRPHKRDGKLTGQWLADIPPSLAGGRRVRKFFDNRIKAEQFAREFDRRYRRGRLHTNANRSGYSSSVAFAEAVARWLGFQRLRVETLKKRQISLTTDQYRLKPLLAFFGSSRLSAITDEMVSEYQKSRLDAGRTPETVNSDLRVLAKVLRWCVKHRWLDQLPDLEKVPVEPREQEIPTPEEVVRIIEALPPRLRPLVQFMAETGCRSGEAFNLTWADIDELKGIVEFKPKDGWMPKTHQSCRRFYIGSQLLETLRGLQKVGPYVFPGRFPDKPIDNIRKAFAIAVHRAGITRNGHPMRITPHTLRKAYATWLADRNVPQHILQANLGHAAGSTVTNQFYVHAQERERRKAIVELPMRGTKRVRKGRKIGNRLATG